MNFIGMSIAAGRKRQSPQTSFVHYFYEGGDRHDAIPILENFCFALALLRSKQAEMISEGKLLLEKILAFRTRVSFPLYLHEYPFCQGEWLGKKIYPVLHWILHDFGAILGDSLREKVQVALRELPKPVCLENPDSPEGWADYVIAAQMEGRPLEAAFSHWNSTLHTFCGPQQQERGEPAPTLFDLMMAEAFGLRLKRISADHPVYLRGALVRSFEEVPQPSGSAMMEIGSTRYWGGPEVLHSLKMEASGKNDGLGVFLPEKEVSEEVEIACYLNIHPDNQILIHGRKETTFQLGDTIEIQSAKRSFFLKFELSEGSGRFFGHLRKGNRSGQIACKGVDRFEAFDWVIALRTVQRSSACYIKYFISP